MLLTYSMIFHDVTHIKMKRKNRKNKTKKKERKKERKKKEKRLAKAVIEVKKCQQVLVTPPRVASLCLNSKCIYFYSRGKSYPGASWKIRIKKISLGQRERASLKAVMHYMAYGYSF